MASPPHHPELDFTGERVVLGKTPRPLVLEHLVRYRFALKLTHPASRVLDVGCGSGYGAALLAEKAAHVTGVDVARDALQYARANHVHQNLSFACAECGNLPFHDASFDRVILFEVIEHLSGQTACLREIRRVLTPQGILILSTPNPAGPTKEIDGPNPFHQKELQEHELLELLRPHFGFVQLLYQHEVNGSTIGATSSPEGDPNAEIVEHFAHDSAPKYFLAVGGHEAVKLPDQRLLGIDGIEHQVSIVLDLRQKEREIEAWVKWREEKEREVAALRKWMEDKELDYTRNLAAHQEVIAGLRKEVTVLNERLSEELATSDTLRREKSALEAENTGRRLELEWLYRWFPPNRLLYKLFYGRQLRQRVLRRLGIRK